MKIKYKRSSKKIWNKPKYSVQMGEKDRAKKMEKTKSE